MEIGDGVFEVLSTNGDTHLGGDNFDEIIMEWLSEEFKKETGIDATKDPIALQRLKDAAEKSKVELSTAQSTEINLPYLSANEGGPQHLVKKLTKGKFESMIDSLITKTIAPCKKALKDSGLKTADIDEVILVGGSTRIPAIQKAVEKFFKKKPFKGVNPDEVVSLGAAIQGGVLGGDVKDVLLLDVTPLSLGIETMGRVMTILIESNTTIPTTKSQIFSTAAPNQSAVDIHVLQGERPMAADNRTLGNFQLTDIPPAPRGVPQIEVSFDIDANGIIKVNATDKGTGKEQNIRIESGNSLSDEEITKMKMEAEKNSKEDNEKKEKIEKLNSVDSMIFQTERQIAEFKDKLSEEDTNSITEVLEKLKLSHQNENIKEMDQYMEELTSVWQEISTKLYQQTESPTEENNDEVNETADVEYEEVN
jgi:molecular chaperone DnaK